MSKDYRGKKVVIYPAYIDSELPRSMGRRVPRSIAVSKPRVDEIIEAAERLGLNPEVEESRYPRAWWLYDKRVAVDKKMPKTKLLRLIASEIKKSRSRK